MSAAVKGVSNMSAELGEIAADLHLVTIALGNEDAPPTREFLQDRIHAIAERAEHASQVSAVSPQVRAPRPPLRNIIDDQVDSNTVYFIRRAQRRVDALLGRALFLAVDGRNEVELDRTPDLEDIKRYALEIRYNLSAAIGESEAYERGESGSDEVGP